MLHHVSVGVSDVERAARFYDPVLAALGYKRVMEYLPHAIAYGESSNWPAFWVQLPHNQMPASFGNGVHVGFIARSKAAVNAFHEAALKNGGSNNGEPGPRADYGPDYYGAFIYDLDGNKLEATLHIEARPAKAKKAPRKAATPARKKAAAKKAAKKAPGRAAKKPAKKKATKKKAAKKKVRRR